MTASRMATHTHSNACTPQLSSLMKLSLLFGCLIISLAALTPANGYLLRGNGFSLTNCGSSADGCRTYTRFTTSRLPSNGRLMAELSTEGSSATTTASSLRKVQEVVAKAFEVDIEKVKPESHFRKDLGADSLQTLELVMTLEESLGIKIPDSEGTKLNTVQEAADFIDNLLKKEKEPSAA